MSDEQKKLIDEAVTKALAGDMDAINNIEDRVTRSKAKAALVKAKRVTTVDQPEQEQSASKKEVEGSAQESVPLAQQVAAAVEKKFPGSVTESNVNGHIQLDGKQWCEIATYLRDDPAFLFDSLQCITGYDFGTGEPLEIRYNLHSMSFNHKIEIRIKTDRKAPQVPSIELVWRIGDWFERETYDMYGIKFTGHRNLSRILCPEDWEGWPLRKDYETQETYHGIVVPKVKEGWE